MPHAVSLRGMGVLAPLAIVGLDLAPPGHHRCRDLKKDLRQVDLTDAVMNGIPVFLVLADAIRSFPAPRRAGTR